VTEDGSSVTIVGQILNDRYEVLEKIGEGGMAIAYRGRDRLLGRVVAVKIMRPELAADASFLARFRREARAAAGVAHEHIASVHDTGRDGQFHYIVMEYVEGESLKDRLRREGPLPLDDALRIVSETAEALEAAHAAGVVHRDIKPHNILLGRDGKIKVTDFGIARAGSFAGQQDTGTVVGSVHYVSPEQARGEVVGPQGDIYALGATLFEMLAGRPPFPDGDRMAVLHKHIYDQAPQPSEARPGLPPEVDSIVAHCLEKDLSRRYASARELLSYLAACPRSEVPGARGARWRPAQAVHAFGGLGPWLRRRAAWAALAGVAIIGAAGGLVYRASSGARPDMLHVEDVVRLSTSAARQLLERSGLTYREAGSAASDDVPVGRVLDQDPPAGTEVERGTAVEVVLSAGPSHVAVPNVAQMSVPQARLNIEAAGLKSGVLQEAHDEGVPIRYVAGTVPAEGVRLARGTSVDLVVSLGPEPATSAGRTGIVSPAPHGIREETLTYVVPGDAERGAERMVAVELVDETGSRRIYEGRHKAGERIPPQRIRIVTTITARILIDGRVRAERQYHP
jgi:serine/threonine-protein kinase